MSRHGLNTMLAVTRRAPPRLHLSRRWLPVCRAPSKQPFRHASTSNSQSHPSRLHLQNDDAAGLRIDTREPIGQLARGHNDEAPSKSTPSLAHLGACAGCGALAQDVEPDDPGYFNVKRRAVANFIRSGATTEPVLPSEEDEMYQQALMQATPQLLESIGSSKDAISTGAPNGDQHMPLCDRCHELLHHHKGAPIHHPSLESIEDTIAESPYKHNHVYHVLDAADFPMSLVPNIQRVLDISPQRSKNRRAKHTGWRHGRKMEMSFIITRSDLLAPKKHQVDTLMPYLINVLRDALGRSGRNVRLGNVRCVSAKRGWWTREVKADIWQRGGAGWMVGKVNVGKSNLFEVVFPKGRAEDINFDALRSAARRVDHNSLEQGPGVSDLVVEDSDNETFMLPPARKEVPFPVMPTVSSLPGTTASPIRIPFGDGKGELIDLPGLARGDLETLVRPEHRQDLVMRSRVSPEQYTIKCGQSLLIGGLVRITPVNEDLIVMAYPFVPIKVHLTSTEKAQNMASGEKAPVSSIIAEDGVMSSLQSAGRFPLKWDVTKARTGPLTSRSAVDLKVDRLPFRVLSTDILVESLGWVELVTQVRRSAYHGVQAHEESDSVEDESETPSSEGSYPEVEIFSPNGSFVTTHSPETRPGSAQPWEVRCAASCHEATSLGTSTRHNPQALPPRHSSAEASDMNDGDSTTLRLAELLRQPDDLDKIPALKSDFTRKKAAVDAQLKIGLKEQLQLTQAGMTSIKDGQAIANQIRDEMMKIDKLCAEAQTLIRDFPEINAVAQAHRNFAQVEAMKSNIESFDVKLKHVLSLIDDDDQDLETQPNLIQIHYGITQLRNIRDDAMDQIKKTNDHSLSATLEDHFKGLDDAIDDFDDHVGAACINLIPLVQGGNDSLVVRLAIVIEEEEKFDNRIKELQDAQREFKDLASRFQSLATGPNELRGYKDKFLEAIKLAAQGKIDESNQTFMEDPDKLEKSVRWYFNDLNTVKMGMVKLMPKKWKIFRTYVKIYHELMYDWLSSRATDKDCNPTHMLAIIHWKDKYYNKMARLGVATKDILDPTLPGGEDSDLVREYRQLIVDKVEEWMNQINKTDREAFVSRDELAHEDDEHGHRRTKTLADMWRMLREQLVVSSTSDLQDVTEGVVDAMYRALKTRTDMWSGLINAELERYARPSLDYDGIEGLQDWLVALANDQIASIVDDSENGGQPGYLRAWQLDYESVVSRDYVDGTGAEKFETMRESMTDLGVLCISVFSRLMFAVDFRTIMTEFFTPVWVPADVLGRKAKLD
ncbi:hypothetical protein FH972_023291 [Carpinus fangiana]|uniref:Exocyst complex component Sec6 n=1 Tax=Carpinus fangiana TaxID=176857 RepID=A0A5N6KUT0_9ROSI|nr:hypothetical protein FH972_023291 [Carpinus fangiana]